MIWLASDSIWDSEALIASLTSGGLSRPSIEEGGVVLAMAFNQGLVALTEVEAKSRSTPIDPVLTQSTFREQRRHTAAADGKPMLATRVVAGRLWG